jgi:hypothetical protein
VRTKPGFTIRLSGELKLSQTKAGVHPDEDLATTGWFDGSIWLVSHSTTNGLSVRIDTAPSRSRLGKSVELTQGRPASTYLHK